MSKGELGYEHYEYVDHLVQILGFSGLTDFMTSIKCSDLSPTQIDQVNQTLEVFRGLFKQRDFNLTHYDGDRLQTPEQLLGFCKKLFVILGINYEVYRFKGRNFLRLKPKNKSYDHFIEKKMSEIRQKFEKEGIQDCQEGIQGYKEVKMSEIMTKYGDLTTHKETKIYFMNKLVVQNVDVYEVITDLTCCYYDLEHDQTTPIPQDELEITLGGNLVSHRSELHGIYLPLSFFKFHELMIVSPCQHLIQLSIKSVKLTPLPFKSANVMVILDDGFFQSHGRIMGNQFGNPTNFFYDHPELTTISNELGPNSGSLEEKLPSSQVIQVGDRQYQIYQTASDNTSTRELINLLGQFSQIDGVECLISDGFLPTYFYKQEQSLMIYSMIFRNGDLIRGIQFNVKEPTPCTIEIVCQGHKLKIFEGLYEGQGIKFKPFSLIACQYQVVFVCVTIPVVHQIKWLSPFMTRIMYVLLNDENRKNEVDKFDLEEYFKTTP